MIPMKSFLKFVVIIVLVIRLRVRAMMVKYEEPFPPLLPVQVKSRVAFTQYGNVPMLSLEEIKRGFPWLEISEESEAGREGTYLSTGSGPKYVFYYVPSEVALHSGSGNYKFHPGYEDRKSETERQNFFREKQNDHRFQVKSNNKPKPSPKELTKKFKHLNKSEDPLDGKFRYELNRNRDSDDQEEGQSESKIRTPEDEDLSSFPKNHKFRVTDFPGRTRSSKFAGTRSSSKYLHPKVPSPYMQLPKLKFEEKEYWVKNKRKSKRPIDDSAVDEERLKNHRIVKQKKSKKLNTENEKRLKNHKPTYDREHDPEERVESSSGKVETLRKRPKENPKNPLLLSQDGERVEFQIHGHEGPQTYIFGFDTGDGENRHFRLEERLRDGSVKGHYGYYDSNGKLKMVEYKARPMGGYEEKHHESNSHNSDQEDDDKIKS